MVLYTFRAREHVLRAAGPAVSGPLVRQFSWGLGHVWSALRNNNKLGVRILLGLFVGMIGVGMLLYLVPGQFTTAAPSMDVVAEVDGEPVTILEIQQQLARIQRTGAIPPALHALYARQALDQLVFDKELAFEARRLGIRVTDAERAERLRLLVPGAFTGETFVGMEAYAQQVLNTWGMDVPEFERLVSQGMIAEKFQQLVTDGITVSPTEVEQEFRRRNEKVQLSYVVIRPDDLVARITAGDAELAAYFEKNKAGYTVPERRSVRYALLDTLLLRLRTNVSDDEIRTFYNQNLDRYQLEDRAHVAHILFKTVGLTDSSLEEVRKRAEDVLRRAKAGGDFAALARDNSEDTTREQGGDLGWIVRGQTVPEFEAVAFRLPKGSISDLVTTQYGIHIIKVVDQEQARTQNLEEVRASILSTLQQQKSEQEAEEIAQQIAEDIRRAGRPPLEDLATKYNLTLGDPPPVEPGQTLVDVGASPEIADTIFRLRPGDVSAPIRTDRGFVVLSVKEALPGHPGTLSEVRDRVLADYRRDQSNELAKSRAEELARRAKAGTDLASAARALGFEAKSSELVARATSIPDIGSASQVGPAFGLAPGQAGDALFLGANWVVFRVLERQAANPEDLPNQRQEITQQLLQSRREMAYEAFRTSLETRLRSEGKLQYNEENMRRLMNSAL
jgi:peptidyl-prolyl cis-trans isomerase D